MASWDWLNTLLGVDTDVVLDTGITADDIININPYTDQYASTLQGYLDNFTSQYQDAYSAYTSAMENVDPSAWINQALGLAGGSALSSLVEQAMGTYSSDASSYASSAAKNAMKEVAAEYSGGSVYSGAFGSALGNAVSDVYSETAMNEASLRSGITSSLMSQLFSGALGAYQSGASTELSGASGLLSSSMSGLSSALSGLGSISQAEYFNPYVTNTNYGSSTLLDALGLLVSGASAVGELSSLFNNGSGATSGVTGFDFSSFSPTTSSVGLPTTAPSFDLNSIFDLGSIADIGIL